MVFAGQQQVPVTSATQDGAACRVLSGQFGCGPFSLEPNKSATIQLTLAAGLRVPARRSAAPDKVQMDISSDGVHDSGPFDIAVASAPPAPTPCKCASLRMTTAPENFTDTSSFEFAINWKIFCSGGPGTCKGKIQTIGPAGSVIGTNGGKALSCYGRCGKLSKGTFHIVGRWTHGLGLKARHGKTFTFHFNLYCVNNGKMVLANRATMTIAYDARGFLDRTHSKFK